VFLFYAIETKNVSIEEIETTLTAGGQKPALATASSAAAE
jgi:hypothetical protein